MIGEGLLLAAFVGMAASAATLAVLVKREVEPLAAALQRKRELRRLHRALARDVRRQIERLRR